MDDGRKPAAVVVEQEDDINSLDEHAQEPSAVVVADDDCDQEPDKTHATENGGIDACYTARLEERVEQLEVKLAVLSRLLQNQIATKSSLVRSATPPQQHPLSTQKSKRHSVDSELTISPDSHKSHDDGDPELSPLHVSEAYDNYCYSSEDDDAALLVNSQPPKIPHTRNLSFRVLYDGMNSRKADMEYRQASAPPTSSMTAAERQWLEPQVLQFVGKEQIEHKPAASVVAPEPTAVALETLFQPPESSAAAAVDSLLSPVRVTAVEEKQHSVPATPALADRRSAATPQRQRNDDLPVKTSNLSINSSNSLVNDDTVRTNFLNYLNSYQESTSDVDQQMQEFISVPGKVERLLNFGLLVCVDSFLYMITILPIRFVWSCALLAIKIVLQLCKRRPATGAFRFHRQHSYQIIQVGILFCICRYVLGVISIGKLYHWIRGQSMIKIYVLIAMVEIFDRLFSSLGQDCLESMYWNTVNRPRSSRMITAVAVVFVYATLHTLILFLHVETLNVAINSADQQLLTLLISGNFAEIKSTVFKKYNKPALFKITASDICERFKLGLFLSLILILNVCQGIEKGQFFGYLRMCMIVWCAELISDAIKHAFITKFNFLPSRVYPEFAVLLAGDCAGIGHEGVNLDHSHAVVKRIGFAQIPLVCVMVRLLQEALKYAKRNAQWHEWLSDHSWSTITTLLAGIWLLMFAVKAALGQILVQISLEKLRAAPEFVDTKALPKEKKKQ